MLKLILIIGLLFSGVFSQDYDNPCTLVGWAAYDGTTNGGDGGDTIVVSTFEDLKAAAEDSIPRVIILFGKVGVGGGVDSRINVNSNKTILGDGGAELHGSFFIYNANNVIVRNLKVRGDGAHDRDGEDAIGIKNSTRVWIDHLDVVDGGDGNLDITRESNYITVSWTKFSYTSASTYHTWSNLIGASDEHTADRGKLKVTMHHNFWAPGATRRMPNVRFGQVHVVNNYYRSEQNEFCIGANFEADMLIENNVFEWVNDPIRYLSTAKAAQMRNNLFIAVSGSKTGKGTAFTPPYSYTMTAVEDVESLVRNHSGPRDINDLICNAQINLDCHGDLNGSASIDSCGICVGGETGRSPCTAKVEAEAACEVDGISLETENTGYSGDGYINTDNQLGASVSWILNTVDDSKATLAFRYANGGSSARDGDLFINGVNTGAVTLAATGSWTNWELSTVQVPLSSGSNEVKLVATSSDGLANLDWLSYSEAISDANCIPVSITQEDISDNSILSFNPTTGIVSFSNPGKWRLYSSFGQLRSSGEGESLDLVDYTIGVYYVLYEAQYHRVFKY